MMRIAVCDDTPADRNALCELVQDYCSEHNYVAQVAAFGSAEALLDAVGPEAFDLYLLDVFLPGMSGVDCARALRRVDPDCLIAFVTVSGDYMPEGFEVLAIGYVEKPVDREKVARIMRNCRSSFERKARTIELPYEGSTLLAPVAELYYVEVFDKHTMFHLRRGDIKVRLPLSKVMEQLSGLSFLHCHRSYVVNLDHVVDVREKEFLMRNGDVVPIRKNGRRELRLTAARHLAGQPFDQSGAI